MRFILVLAFIISISASVHGQTPPPYAELKQTLDAGYVIIEGNKLRFRYEEKYSEGNLNFQIYNNQRTALVNSGVLILTKKLGVNYFEITLNSAPLSLSPCNGGATSCYYILEVRDDKGQVWKLRFKY